MTTRVPLTDWLAAACGLVLVGAAWHWRGRVVHTAEAPPPKDSWEDVRQQFPMPAPLSAASSMPADALNAVVEANPFSPERRQAPAATSGGQTSAAATQQLLAPPAPAWVYKGRVQMGGKQVAILGDETSGKTHFVHVGQEVAGFRVVDIADNRVTLQNLATNDTQVLMPAPSAGSSASPAAASARPTGAH